MMNKLSRLLPALVLCLSGWAARAGDGDTVTWIDPDFPPYFIHAGAFANQGQNDRQMQIVMQHLPQFRYKMAEVPMARGWYDLSRTDGICMCDAAKSPEREKFALYSKPTSIDHGMVVMIRTDAKDRFAAFTGADGRIDIGKLTRQATLRGGLVKGRDYGAVVSAALRESAGNPALTEEPFQDRLFNLIKSGRVDFILTGILEYAYFVRSNNLAGQFSYYEISGNDQTLIGYIACSNGLIGRKFIEAVNEQLDKRDLFTALQVPRREWLASVGIPGKE